MNTVSLSCLVAFGSVLALGACGTSDPTPASTPGTGGSAAGTTSAAGTGGSVAAGGSIAGGTTGGSVSTGGGGVATGGSGGLATGGGGSGGAAAGSGGLGGAAGGTGGAGGGSACDAKTGKALSFKMDKIDLVAGDLGADLPGLDTPRTVELWAHFLGTQSWTAEHTVIELGRKTNDSNQVFGLDMANRNGDNGVFDPYTNGVGDNDPTAVMLAPEGWHHLAWGFDSGHFQFVVDGNKIALAHEGGGTAMLKTTQGIITLAGSQGFGYEGWEGVMDEVRVWNILRTPDDIKRDMKVKLKGTEPGLVAYYNLDEGTGTTADDIAKKNGHKLSFCDSQNGACPTANNATPTWVDSDIPGPFTCAP